MIRIFILLSVFTVLTSCGNRKAHPAATAEQSSETAAATSELEIYGTYAGTLPAADGPGIAVSLTLFDDGNYTRRSEYLERDAVFNEQGRFTIDEELLTLYPDQDEADDCYRIEANRLRLLDRDKKPITGELAEYYVLTRKTDK